MWNSRNLLQVATLKPSSGKRFVSPTVLSEGNTLAAQEIRREENDLTIQIWQAPTWDDTRRIEEQESLGENPIPSQ